jgi:putative FmdB family regulatory protein
MPIYEYKCQKCEKEFEELQGITDPPVSLCPFCNGPVTKLLSLSSFHLKGSGWYTTDYGNRKPEPTEGTKEGKTEGKAEEISAGKTDAAKPTAAKQDSANT